MTTHTFTGSATDTMGASASDTATINSTASAPPRKVHRSLMQNRLQWGSAVDTSLRGPTFSDAAAEPFLPRSSPPDAITLSMIFQVRAPCRFTGCRVYKAPNATGAISFTLWQSSTLVTGPTSTGTVLGTQSAGTWAVDGGGWRQVTFASPVNLVPGVSYVIGFRSIDGIFAYTQWVWNAQDTVVWPLENKALFEGSGVRSDGSANSATGTYPETVITFPQNHNATNYYIDPQVEWDEPLPGYTGTNTYFDQWANLSLPTRYGFPVAVFLADPPYLPAYVAMGVQMLMGGSPHTGNGQEYLDAMAAMGYSMDWWPYLDAGSGTSTFNPTSELVQLMADEPGLAAAVRGYLLDDEPDLVAPYRSPDLLRAWVNAIRQKDSLRPIYLGFGRFMTRNQGFFGMPVGASMQTVNDLWRQWAGCADVIGCDDYSWYDDNNSSGNFGVWAYAAQIGRLREISDDSKPVWGIVETCARVAGAPVPEDIRKAVWAMLIAGARGLILFDHRFGNDFVTTDFAAMLNDPPMKAMMTTLITRIQSLATALYAADLGLVTAYTSSNTTAGPIGGTFGVPIHYASRSDGTHEYVFAQGIRPGATTATLTIPSWAGLTVDVLDESRTVTVSGGGVLTDTFAADYTTHLYRRP